MTCSPSRPRVPDHPGGPPVHAAGVGLPEHGQGRVRVLIQAQIRNQKVRRRVRREARLQAVRQVLAGGQPGVLQEAEQRRDGGQEGPQEAAAVPLPVPGLPLE